MLWAHKVGEPNVLRRNPEVVLIAALAALGHGKASRPT
jgi:hypothetical protein